MEKIDKEIVDKFSFEIHDKLLRGFQIIFKSDVNFDVILVKPAEKVNHWLHFIICLTTALLGYLSFYLNFLNPLIWFVICGFWIIHWIVIEFRSQEQRVRIIIDNDGKIKEMVN